jgi:flagellar basal body-associated protein FliL
MADDEIAAVDEEKKGKGKLIGIVVGVLVLLGVAYFMFLGGGGDGSEEAGVTTTTVIADGPVIEVDEMTITLADDPVRYARLKFAVVLPEGGDTTVVGDRVPLLKDAVLSAVSGYTVDQLVGADALSTLRDQLTASALTVFTEGEVLRVVITEVLVQ